MIIKDFVTTFKNGNKIVDTEIEKNNLTKIKALLFL